MDNTTPKGRNEIRAIERGLAKLWAMYVRNMPNDTDPDIEAAFGLRTAASIPMLPVIGYTLTHEPYTHLKIMSSRPHGRRIFESLRDASAEAIAQSASVGHVMHAVAVVDLDDEPE